MSLVPGTIVHQGNAVGGVMPDISSALGYKEHIDSACINPNGYTAGSYFVGADDGYFYCVTANIAAGDTITVGTNCVQTDVAAEISRISSDLTEKEDKFTPVSGNGATALFNALEEISSVLLPYRVVRTTEGFLRIYAITSGMYVYHDTRVGASEQFATMIYLNYNRGTNVTLNKTQSNQSSATTVTIGDWTIY